jgi:hypothetical protein
MRTEIPWIYPGSMALKSSKIMYSEGVQKVYWGNLLAKLFLTFWLNDGDC